MQIQVTKQLRFSPDGSKELDCKPGIYRVPSQIPKSVAEYALAFRMAHLVVEQIVPIGQSIAPKGQKFAPENKILGVSENKRRKKWASH